MKKIVLLIALMLMWMPTLAWAVDEPIEPTVDDPIINTLPPGPTSPTGLIAKNITQNSVDISWHTNPAVEDIDSYNIYKDGLFQTNTDQNKYTASNLEPGKTYKFYVTAQNINGEGPASEVLVVETKSPYQPPKNLRATNIGSSTINVSWDGQAPNYEVYVNDLLADVTPYSTYSITELEPDQPYEIYVKAVYDEEISTSGDPEVYETSEATSEASNILTLDSGTVPVPASVEGIVGASFPYIKMLVPFLIMAFSIGATFLIIENMPVFLGRRRY